MNIEGFEFFLKENWSRHIISKNNAHKITAKFKRLRQGLKQWAKSKASFKLSIKNTNEVILLLDKVEEFKNLTDVECNGRMLLKEHLLKMLKL